MKRDLNPLEISLRYLLIVLLALGNFFLIYLVFTPLTIYPIYFILNVLFDASIYKNVIFAKGFPIEIIGPCIASSAYYLLTILNLSTPNIVLKKRIYLLLSSFGLFLLLNLTRIFALSLLLFADSSLFEIAHQTLWYLGGTIFILLIWFSGVKIFNIKGIPLYTDLKDLYRVAKR